MRSAFALWLVIALVACSPSEDVSYTPTFHAETNPVTLAEWGQVSVGEGELRLADRVMPYDLNTALFSDYALKLRTVWLPEGADPAGYQDRDTFDFPVGTVITKTFYYPRSGDGIDQVALTRDSMAHFDGAALDLSEVRLIETRILVHRSNGWAALPYIWNEDQSEATLSRTGGFVELTLVSASGDHQELDYLVPNVNQCSSCHETDTSEGGLQPIGPKARHINRSFDYIDGPENQIDAWIAAGLLSGSGSDDDRPRAAAWTEGIPVSEMLEPAARAYLDINCAHCHSRTGPADTSGLYLEPWEPAGPNLGLCKPPIAAGRGTGGADLWHRSR